MDPLLVLFGGLIAFFAVFSLLLSLHSMRGRRPVGEQDYGRMAEIEADDIDQMVESIDETRRRNGRRDVGEELADELMRGTWEAR